MVDGIDPATEEILENLSTMKLFVDWHVGFTLLVSGGRTFTCGVLLFKLVLPHLRQPILTLPH